MLQMQLKRQPKNLRWYTFFKVKWAEEQLDINVQDGTFHVPSRMSWPGHMSYLRCPISDIRDWTYTSAIGHDMSNLRQPIMPEIGCPRSDMICPISASEIRHLCPIVLLHLRSKSFDCKWKLGTLAYMWVVYHVPVHTKNSVCFFCMRLLGNHGYHGNVTTATVAMVTPYRKSIRNFMYVGGRGILLMWDTWE